MVKLILPRIKVNVKITLPSTFVVDGAQTIENEEYEESIKDVEECVACKAIINQDVHTVTSSRSCQHRQSIC